MNEQIVIAECFPASERFSSGCSSIKDTGIGIEADALPQLFRMFSQAASDRTRVGDTIN